MILLDSTVLVYAVGADHPLRDPSRRIVSAIGEGRLQATATVETLQEFAHVQAHRRPRSDSAALTGRFADLLSPLVTVDRDDLVRGLAIFERYDGVGAFDAVLASVVMGRDHLDALVSADTGFAAITGLRHLAPADVRIDVP